MKHYNGQLQTNRRRYDSLRNFVGRNEVYKRGDILYVSTKNNDKYDLILDADGVSTFAQLYHNNGKDNSGSIPPNSVGSKEIINGSILPEDLSEELKEKIYNANGLTDDEKEMLSALKSADVITEGEVLDEWQKAIKDAETSD